MLSSRQGFYLIVFLFIGSCFYHVNAEPAPAYRVHATKSKVAKTKVHINKQGMKFVKNYIQKSKADLVSIKRRSTIPFNIIDSIFKQNGLPLQLKYLAVIESELKTSAKSKVGAVGPWQLMPTTARLLGLKVNKHVDERTNYYKSTQAAARYLKDLHAEFKDWLLVLAAYNGGPGPVYTAIRESGSRNFWALQYHLPTESRLHVNRFLATNYYFEGSLRIGGATKPTIVAKSNKPAVLINENKKELALANSSDVKTPESTDEKFNRIMNASTASLQKSNQLMGTDK